VINRQGNKLFPSLPPRHPRPESEAVPSRLLALIAAGWLLSPAALAQETLSCAALQERYQALAEQALQQEILLLKTVRQQLCPAISQQAESGQSALSEAEPIDFDALLSCRHRAEAQLQATRQPLYRNRQRLAFYTARGAALAREADDVLLRKDQAGTSAQAGCS
jgi:hypothetical protein